MSLKDNSNNNIVHDCVGKTGYCPVVTKVEDCHNFVNLNKRQIKEFEEVKECETEALCLEDPEKLFEDKEKYNSFSLKDKIDLLIRQLIDIHNSL